VSRLNPIAIINPKDNILDLSSDIRHAQARPEATAYQNIRDPIPCSERHADTRSLIKSCSYYKRSYVLIFYSLEHKWGTKLILGSVDRWLRVLSVTHVFWTKAHKS